MNSGGCLCGAVHYEAEGEPIFSGLCHCRDCQKASGSGHNPVMAVPRSSVKITGETKSFSMAGESGRKVTRTFCPTCGSRLFSESEGMPGLLIITAGSLDDMSAFKPQMAIYTRSRPQWAPTGDGIREFEAAPPAPPPGSSN